MSLLLKVLLTGVLLLITCQVMASDQVTNPALGRIFQDADVNGTFVLYDASGDYFTIHDQLRAEQRFIPASTFKIPNSLIGLASGAIEDVDDVLPYGGKPQFIEAWERDMGLREAIRISNVPIYQELARRIGLQRMSEYVNLLNYGNGNIGERVDMFWLEGPLKISAIEQSRFMARLGNQALPLSKQVQESVHDILEIDRGHDWVLYAKTGWGTASETAVGWWVGWVEKQGHIYSFALNMDMPDLSDAAKRQELGRACLEALAIIGNRNHVQH